jgi:hypothetical protein
VTTATSAVKWSAFQDRENTNFTTPAEFYRYGAKHQYAVWAETRPGLWVCTYHGNDQSRAHQSIEFWDARVNAVYVDTSTLSDIDRKWNDLFWRIKHDDDYGNQVAA